MKNYLAYDLGGTFIKFALMDEDCKTIEQGKEPSPLDTLDHLLEVMKEIADRYAGRFAGAAVSMPGRIDTKHGIAHTGGAYSGFINDTPFAQLLSEKIGCPVVIGNDGKCAAKAEAARGILKDTENGAVIVLGTGTGGGIILNHQVWMGQSGGAGEISSLVCDIHGLVKDGFSMYNFKSIYAGYGSATGLISMYGAAKGMDLMEAFQKVNGVTFFEAYDAGEPEAIEVLKQFGLYTAAGILSIQCVLDLERFAIGGGISARKEITDSIRNGVEQLFNAEFALPYSKPEIVTCTYGNDANLVGAVSFLQEQM